MDLRGYSEDVLDGLPVKEAEEGFDFVSVPPFSFALSFSRFSPVVFVEVPLLKSSDVPGVLGVLAEDPKEAKAPEPSPKAEEAPDVGDATLVVVKGAIPLNGLDLLLKDPSPPKRFAGWYGREDSVLFFSLVVSFVSAVERASLLELLSTSNQHFNTILKAAMLTSTGVAIDYP